MFFCCLFFLSSSGFVFYLLSGLQVPPSAYGRTTPLRCCRKHRPLSPCSTKSRFNSTVSSPHCSQTANSLSERKRSTHIRAAGFNRHLQHTHCTISAFMRSGYAQSNHQALEQIDHRALLCVLRPGSVLNSDSSRHRRESWKRSHESGISGRVALDRRGNA